MTAGDQPAASAATSAESERQRALIAALWTADAQQAAQNLPCVDGPVPVARGLAAYRANAGAHAARALEGACPTVQALIGSDDFRRLAREHWMQALPTSGDLAEWGGALGAGLEAHPALLEWPYLGDCARLDWAVHQCERAADAVFDAGSISRLGDTDPRHLHLELRPGTAVLRSRWPVVLIHDAHRQADTESALAAVSEALAQGVGEIALVARSGAGSGWRAQVHRIDAATALWTERLLAGDSLSAALGAVDAAADADRDNAFDLGTWLATALREGWLTEIRVCSD